MDGENGPRFLACHGDGEHADSLSPIAVINRTHKFCPKPRISVKRSCLAISINNSLPHVVKRLMGIGWTIQLRLTKGRFPI